MLFDAHKALAEIQAETRLKREVRGNVVFPAAFVRSEPEPAPAPRSKWLAMLDDGPPGGDAA